jgi:methionine synthase reductase
VTKFVQLCTKPEETKTLALLVGKTEFSKSLWKFFVESQCLGVGELILLFPSLQPSIPQLVDLLLPMPPRYYSIASSPVLCAYECAIAFSVVRYRCGFGVNNLQQVTDASCVILREGLCTGYLEDLVEPLLRSNSLEEHTLPKIRVFHKPTINFHLPGNVSHPLILIGPGTGVAPFIGFLQHRSHMKNKDRDRIESGDEDMCCGVWRGGFELETKDLPSECNQVGEYMRAQSLGAIYLFCGCRDENDHLFREELQNYLAGSELSPGSGNDTPSSRDTESCGHRVLSHLEVAMSRVGPEKVYVTHKVRELGATISRLLVHDCAHLYICGDGNIMAKDVGQAIKDILMKHEHMTASQADELIVDMKQRRRYVLDIWS